MRSAAAFCVLHSPVRSRFTAFAILVEIRFSLTGFGGAGAGSVRETVRPDIGKVRPRLFAFVVVLARVARCGRNGRAGVDDARGMRLVAGGSQRTGAKCSIHRHWMHGYMQEHSHIYFPCVGHFQTTSNNLLHQMGTRGPLSSAIRTFVVGSFVRGTLASLDEGAMVAGVDRSTVMRWLRAERIDWKAKRLQFLAKQRNKAVLISEGKTVARPSKQELRRQAEEAKAKWDALHHGQHS